jgi:TldD protein
MPTPIQTVSESLLAPGGLTVDDLPSLVHELAMGDVDFADLFFERAEGESFTLEDGEVKDASFHRDSGVGVRTCVGDRQGFAYTQEVTVDRIREAGRAAAAIQKGQSKQTAIALSPIATPTLYRAINPIAERASQDKIAYLLEIDRLARQRDPRVVQVQATLSIWCVCPSRC